MRRRRSGVLALAVVAALSCTGCVKAGGYRTGEDRARDEARQLALEDAEQVAGEVERLQFPQDGSDPGTPGHRRAWTNAGMVERIASEYGGPEAGPSDRVLQLEIMPGQRWAGFLGAVEVAITRRAETGGGLFYATGSATRGVGRLLVTGAQTDECAPAPDKVIDHTNLYWRYQKAPDRTAGVVKTEEVEF